MIYDDVCPLCKAYTNGFVELGWLLPHHRVGFSNITEDMKQRIDIDRARHEIPLYDIKTGETLYGKEALFFILGERFPILKPLFQFFIFRFFINILYQIITYNRRIIAGSKPPVSGFDCAPDFNLFYRFVYIFVALSISGVLQHKIIQSIGNELFIFYGFALLAAFFVLFIKGFEKQITYLGHLATVILILHLFGLVLGFSIFTVLILLTFGTYLMYRRLG